MVVSPAQFVPRLRQVQPVGVHLKLGDKQSVVGEGEVRWPHLAKEGEERRGEASE